MTDHDRHGDTSRPADRRNRMAIGAILAAVLVVLLGGAAIGWAVVQQEQGGGVGEGVATADVLTCGLMACTPDAGCACQDAVSYAASGAAGGSGSCCMRTAA